MSREAIIKRILDILRSGATVELHIEHGKLVIVKLNRKAERTEYQITE